MRTKREYERIVINTPVVIYTETQELSGIIKNISEGGVGVLFDHVTELKKGDIITLCFAEKSNEKDFVVIVRIEIVRTETDGNTSFIGGKIYGMPEDVFRQFVEEKKVEFYLNSGCYMHYLSGVFI